MRRCPRCDLAATDTATRCLRCRQVLDDGAAGPLLVDGRYAVESEVGRGSMGVVYKARDVNLGRAVALKLISPEFARNATFVERFRREAHALASIRNDHVVQIYTMGMHDGAYFYAMEFIEGRNLEAIIREHLAHGSYVPTYRALTILRQVAQGLAAVHATGLVHRDVKPANIVIEDVTGRPVLLDFGLARPLRPDALRATAAVGSPHYMAPEQIAPDGPDEHLSPRTDVYALGCTAFELLTGSPPFSGDGIYAVLHRHLNDPPPLLSARRPELAVLDDVLTRALEKNPAFRYESCTAFADAVEHAARRWRAVGTPLPPPLTAPPSWRPMAADDGPALRVLVVDDDPLFCKMAAQAARLAIHEAPVDVVEVNSGVRALTACLEGAPQLVVLDYDMPGPNGIDTLSELRALPGAAQAPVLVVSASVGDVERWRFSVLGVKDFLAKPVAFQELVETIRRLTVNTQAANAATNPSLETQAVAVPTRESGLPLEVFLLLLAVGWADGRLDEVEREAVFAAAREEGFGPDGLAVLARHAAARVEMADVDVSRLRTRERMYVYAVARWIAELDGELTDRETAMLRVLGFALGMPQRSQAALDAMVRDVLADAPDARSDAATLGALRVAVEQRFVEGAR